MASTNKPRPPVQANAEPLTASEAPTITLGEIPEIDIEPRAAPGTPDSAVLGVGDMLANRYHLVERIGEGGMSCVYKAVDAASTDLISPDRFIAVKVLTRPFPADSAAFAALQREVQALRELEHPHIVRIFGCDHEGSVVFMTLEYLVGNSLFATLHAPSHTAQPTGNIGHNEALSIIATVGDALEFAHRNGVVHGDLKPGNVFITDRGEVKVIDFGIASWLTRPQTALERREAAQSRPAATVTPRYASPQLMARHKPEPSDDVYSLACVAYELLTGSHPFDGTAGAQLLTFPPPLRAGMTPPQYAAIVKGLQLERRERTASVRQFVEDFGARESRDGWRKSWVAMGVFALVAGIMGYLLYPTSRPMVPPTRVTVPDVAIRATTTPTAPTAEATAAATAAAGAVLQDCPTCPPMIVVPAGRFTQGVDNDDSAASSFEKPAHPVIITAPFALSATDVTVGAFGEFVAATGRSMNGCEVYDAGRWQHRRGASWKSPGFPQDALHPVACVSWDDASAFAMWLSSKSGHRYRLPTAAEWEYAARAGGLPRPWDADGSSACASANVADQSAARRFPGWEAFGCDDGFVYTSPVGSFKANAFGLKDMLGNVFQWTEDCWYPDYRGAPEDGTAHRSDACTDHELRGGSWFSPPAYVRASYRNHFATDFRTSSVGFRLLREMEP